MGWGGGGCRKFESFVGNLGGFAPPPEKVNFRHWSHMSHIVKINVFMMCIFIVFKLVFFTTDYHFKYERI
jgi:hypothetical protein